MPFARASVSAGTVALVDTRRGAVAPCRAHWNGHHNAVFDVKWADGDATLLTAGGDQTARVWDAATGMCTAVLAGHSGSVKGVAAGGGGLVATCSRDGSVMLWDARAPGGGARVAVVPNAHWPAAVPPRPAGGAGGPAGGGRKRGQGASPPPARAVTCVAFVEGEGGPVRLLSGGAADGCAGGGGVGVGVGVAGLVGEGRGWLCFCCCMCVCVCVCVCFGGLSPDAPRRCGGAPAVSINGRRRCQSTRAQVR